MEIPEILLVQTQTDLVQQNTHGNFSIQGADQEPAKTLQDSSKHLKRISVPESGAGN